MRKSTLLFGLIGAFLLGSVFFFMPTPDPENMDYESGEIIGYISMLVGLTTVVLGVRSVSRQLRPEPFSFLSAFKTGLAIAVMGSLGYALGWIIYFNTIGDNGMMDGYFEQQIIAIQNNPDLTEAEKSEEIADSTSFKELYLGNNVVMFGISLLEIFPLGLLVSLISAFVFRRK